MRPYSTLLKKYHWKIICDITYYFSVIFWVSSRVRLRNQSQPYLSKVEFLRPYSSLLKISLKKWYMISEDNMLYPKGVDSYYVKLLSPANVCTWPPIHASSRKMHICMRRQQNDLHRGSTWMSIRFFGYVSLRYYKTLLRVLARIRC